jgi:hypothetical protein
VSKEKPPIDSVIDGVKVNDILNMKPRDDLWDDYSDDDGTHSLYEAREVSEVHSEDSYEQHYK